MAIGIRDPGPKRIEENDLPEPIVAKDAVRVQAYRRIRPGTPALLDHGRQGQDCPPTRFADSIESVDDQASKAANVNQF